MSSSLLSGRRLCIIIAVIILLFLPSTFSTNLIIIDVSAQTPHCTLDGPYDVAWCIYEREVENYPHCVEGWNRYNEMIKGHPAFEYMSDLLVDPSERCQLSPPEPLQPLDCNELQTCPKQTTQIECAKGAYPTTTGGCLPRECPTGQTLNFKTLKCGAETTQVECPEGWSPTTLGVCLRTACPAGQRHFGYFGCEAACLPGQRAIILGDTLVGCEDHGGHILIDVGHSVWDVWEMFKHFRAGPLPPIFPKDVLFCPFAPCESEDIYY